MNQSKLDKILKLHKLYLKGDPSGVRADLSGANLCGADLRWSNLREANPRGADLEGAYLGGADLRWADLRWANLRWADLRGANLCLANLSGADLRGANIIHYVDILTHRATVTRTQLCIGCSVFTRAKVKAMNYKSVVKQVKCTPKQLKAAKAKVLAAWKRLDKQAKKRGKK